HGRPAESWVAVYPMVERQALISTLRRKKFWPGNGQVAWCGEEFFQNNLPYLHWIGATSFFHRTCTTPIGPCNLPCNLPCRHCRARQQPANSPFGGHLPHSSLA